MLTSAGGLLGVLMGSLVSFLVKVLVDLPTVLPGLGHRAVDGDGRRHGPDLRHLPGWRASRLDPVEAMRHE
jgi:hypothetical protein